MRQTRRAFVSLASAFVPLHAAGPDVEQPENAFFSPSPSHLPRVASQV